MKAKRFLSLLVALTMLVSVFSGLTVFAEDEAVEAVVTATVGSSDLTDATDVALSFKSTITLPQAIATGTDLSGIVITGGEEDITPTVTEGAATDGLITQIVVITPVLANDTTYTLVVPALGSNEAASFDFTTVPENYIVKEDFVGGYSSTWINKLKNPMTNAVVTPEGYLNDTDGDGIVDIMKGLGGDSNNTLWLPANVPLDGVDQLTIETRVKYYDPTSKKTYTLEDGSLKDDNDNNNGGLLLVRASSHNNYNFSIRTTTGGFLCYGGINGRSFTTDYKLYNNKWYTIRLVFSADEVNASLFITDDEGNSYQGPVKQNMYGASWPITPLSEVKYSYGAYIRSDIEYLNVWANDAFGEVTSTLDGDTDLNADDKEVTLTFTNDITAEDAAKISVGDGATAVATLTDSKTVTLAISDLTYGTDYEINVPQLGANKAKVFTFSTEKEPIPVFAINGTDIEGKDNIAVDFKGTLTFVKPVATGTDLSGITLSTGDDAANITIAEGTVTDGYFTTVSITTPVLKAGRTYTLSVPAIGNNIAKDIEFNTVPLSYIVKEDFNGGYSSYWTGKKETTLATQSNLVNTDSDGVVDAMGPIGGDNNNWFRLPSYASMADVSGLTIETRVKYADGPGGDYVLEDGSFKNDGNYNDGGLLRIRGNGANNNSFIMRTNAEGYVTVGGVKGEDVVSDYKLYNNKWYTIKIEFDASEVTANFTITDDDGKSYTVQAGNSWGSTYPINPLSDVKYSYNYYIGATIDYLYVYDSAYEGKVNVTYNDGLALDGAEDIIAGEALTVNAEFDDAITAADLEKITVAGATVSGVLSDDGLTATLTITGLNTYEKTYALVIPEIGLNEAKTVSFTTKAEAPATKVKQNGVNINGYTNMPLSFSPTIEFVYGIADATDLTGITIARKDGASTTATIAVTQGAATDGTFTTAKAVIANLERGTEYVVSVPAYGNNEAKSITFTTVASPYYVYDEFNGFVANDWYQDKDKKSLLTALEDIDSDGVGDALYYTAFLHPSLVPASTIDMSAAGEIVYETRAKFKANSDSYLNADNSLKTGDSNNGGLLRIRGTAGLSWIRFRTDEEGYLQYGQTNGDDFTTDYKIYQNKWYTFRITIASNGKTFKMTVVDEDGKVYDGPFKSTSYGGIVMKGFKTAEFSYGSFVDSTIDYFRLWDNAALGAVSALYNGADLNGATDVEVGDKEVEFTFENPVTQADLAKISSNASIEFELAEDGLSAIAKISGISEYNNVYIINVPAIAGNKATVVSFTTETRPILVVYEKDGEEVTLVNATEMPTEFDATVKFLEAVPEDADLSTITINGGSVTATLSEDRMSADLTISGLRQAGKYILSVPAYGGNNALDVTFMTFKGEYLFKADFDGLDDDYAWYERFEGTRTKLYNSDARVANGYWDQQWSNSKYRAFCPTFSTNTSDAKTWSGGQPLETDKLDVKDKTHVQVETKFKFGEGDTLDGRFFYIGYNRVCVGIADGVFVYNSSMGTNPANTPFMVNETQYAVERNVWYTLSVDINFETSRYTVTLSDDNGNIANSETLQFINLVTNIEEIADVRMYRTLSSAYAPVTYDYLYIIDRNYGKVDVTYDAGVPASLDGSALVPVNDNIFEFTLENVPADLSKITLVDEDGNTVAVNTVANGNTVSVVPAALSYNTKYTLTIPKEYLGSETDQEVKFTTVWDANAEFVYPEGFSAEDELDVVFYGGSITWQEGWRVHTTNWFKEKFPNAKCYNSSVGGTGAYHGWQRLDRDMLPNSPDIVFIEFAVNDANSSTTGRDVEAIIRNLNKLDKPPVIILVYTTVSNFTKNLDSIALQEKTANHYGVPTISIHDYTQTRYNTEAQFKADWDGTVYIGTDRTHPTTEGGKLYGDYVTALLESEPSKYFVRPSANALTTPLYADFMDYVYDATYLNKTLSNTGDTYEFTFEGDFLGIEYTRREAYGIFSVEVDGEVVSDAIDCYYAGSNARPLKRYSGFGEGTHTAKITVTGQNEKATDDKVHIHSIYQYDTKTKITRPVFDKTEVKAGEKITVYTSYQGEEIKDGILLVATYGSDNKMKRLIDTGSFTTTATDKETYKSVEVTPVEGEAYIKAFVWDGIGTMIPYTISTQLGTN